MANNGILMNVILMMNEILSISNAVIGKAALPDFGISPDQSAERMRVSALD